jgi:hypothetical protein
VTDGAEDRAGRRVWLFATDLSLAELGATTEVASAGTGTSAVFRPDPAPEGACHALTFFLGAEWLDLTQLEVIDAGRLGQGGLARHLVEVMGMDPTQIGAVGDALGRLRGRVIVVHEAAFDPGVPKKVFPAGPLMPLGVYSTEPSPVLYRAEALPTRPPRTLGYGVVFAPVLVLGILGVIFWGG